MPLDTLMSAFLHDLRFAFRAFRKYPGYTCAALVTLALGIGANTAIYSVIDGVLLHPIPFPEPDRLVALYQTGPHSNKNAVTYPNLLDWQRSAQSFEALAGMRTDGFTLTGGKEPEPVTAMMVSAEFFSVLRVQPLAGRAFTKQEDQRGAPGVIMLGEDFWKRRFGVDHGVIGKRMVLNDRDYTVIGIVPSTVRWREADLFMNDVFLPIGQKGDALFYERGTGDGTMGLARLKPGVTVAAAQAEMSSIMRSIIAANPTETASAGVNVASFQQELVGDLRPTLLALSAAVGFVLLIACANVANLALARSSGRRQEFAVRLALGAGRSRLARQILGESVLLSIVGGVFGMAVASWVTDAALALLPSILPPMTRVAINGRVLLFSFAVSLLAGVLFGAAPALNAAGLNLNDALKQGGRGVTPVRHRAQQILLVGEMALTFMLLVGAGLMIRSLQKLWTVDPGFDPQGVVVFYTGISPERASTPDKIRTVLSEMNERLASISGVESASVGMGGLPFLGNTTVGFTTENDDPARATREPRMANYYAVSRDHFRTMRIPLVRGRAFTPQDTTDSPRVVIIDEELARNAFGNEDPIGKHITAGVIGPRPAKIVGIAGHVKHSGLDKDAFTQIRSQLYAPIAQVPNAFLPFVSNITTCVVRSSAPTASLMNSVRKELAALGTGRAVAGEHKMTDAIATSLAGRRFLLALLAAFAITALLLSGVGIYGVVSYFVGQRTNEIGIRISLGAEPRNIFLDVISEGGKLGLIGGGIGLVAAGGLSRWITTLVFGVSPLDIITYSSAGAFLLAMTIAACWIPARRAVRVDPVVALRSE